MEDAGYNISGLPSWKDRVLFTPGPLTTSLSVKQQMLHDLGSWEVGFNTLVKEIREKLLQLAAVSPADFTVIPMQGSGTFGVEAVLASVVPPGGRVMVLTNGAYGERICTIAQKMQLDYLEVVFPENEPVDPEVVREKLQTEQRVDLVAVVHCETTSGLLNPIDPIGQVVREFKVDYFVDTVSSFGAVPIDIDRAQIDYFVSSANKCIEGVPGFSFVFARLERFLATRGDARSHSLDLLDQWEGFERNGKFRFTPPTHTIAAFGQALVELEQEGGVAARRRRYERNHQLLVEGMAALGFETYVPPAWQSYIITTFLCPDHPKFSFETLYDRLRDRGYIIYDGKVTGAACFRIGTIGRICENDILDLLAAIKSVLQSMEVELTPKENVSTG